MTSYLNSVHFLICELGMMLVLYLKGYCKDGMRKFHVRCTAYQSFWQIYYSTKAVVTIINHRIWGLLTSLSLSSVIYNMRTNTCILTAVL